MFQKRIDPNLNQADYNKLRPKIQQIHTHQLLYTPKNPNSKSRSKTSKSIKQISIQPQKNRSNKEKTTRRKGGKEMNRTWGWTNDDDRFRRRDVADDILPGLYISTEGAQGLPGRGALEKGGNKTWESLWNPHIKLGKACGPLIFCLLYTSPSPRD